MAVRSQEEEDSLGHQQQYNTKNSSTDSREILHDNNLKNSSMKSHKDFSHSRTDFNAIHPDLRGGQPALPNNMNSQQMESLTAICDTFIPSLPVRSLDFKLHEQREFFKVSASQVGTPTEAAGLTCNVLDKRVTGIILWILWLLSTRLGTLILCGRHSLTGQFPFLHPFTKLPLINREHALRSWATGRVVTFQSLFKVFKSFCMYSFFSKADAAGHNDIVWNAIGYPPLNPSWNGLEEDENPKDEEEQKPPLPVFDMQACSTEELIGYLSTAGCNVQQQEIYGNEEEQEALTIDCDVVVVGSGAGGGVCAAVLASKGHKVIVIEKGKYYAPHELSLLEGPSMHAMYETGGLLATLDGGINILAGSTVGGGTAVNWSASFKTPQNVIDEWSEVHGLKWFKSQEYTSAMDKVCERIGVGVRGDEEEFESFQNAVLRKGCKKLGYHVETIPRNCRKKKHMCGMCGYGCKTGQKQGVHETWLRDAVSSGAVILSSCLAEKVVVKPLSGDQVRAYGVLVKGGGNTRVLIRAKATVVSCGSLHTPILLKKSGITNRVIGSNLRLHPVQLVCGYFPNAESAVWEGPIMTAVSRLGDGVVMEVPAIHPIIYTVLAPWLSGASFKEQMLKYSRTAHVMVLVRDRGSGSVRPNRFGSDAPAVQYKVSSEDAERLKNGMEKAVRVLIAAGAEEVGILHPDGDRIKTVGISERDIKRFLDGIRGKDLNAGMSTGSGHQMGSCRMGVDPDVSAVDPHGEVWGCKGLFVADASVFPTSLGVNPMVTVQSVAYCIAHSVDRRLQQ